MDSSGLIVPNVQYAITHRYVDVAMLALIFCEHIATFTDEIRFIWRHRFTSISVLYVLSRYGLLVLGVLMVVNDSLVDLPSCKVISRMQWATMVLLNTLFGAFSAIRVYVLSGKNATIAATVFFVHVVIVALSIYQWVVQVVFAPSAPFRGCQAGPPLSQYTPIMIMMTVQGVLYVLSDVTVIAFTVYSTMGTLRKAPARAKVQFAIVFMRDGSIYFATMLVLSLYSFVYPMVTAIPLPWMMSLLSTLPSILISRFILNLREAEDNLSYQSSSESVMASFPLASFVQSTGEEV